MCEDEYGEAESPQRRAYDHLVDSLASRDSSASAESLLRLAGSSDSLEADALRLIANLLNNDPTTQQVVPCRLHLRALGRGRPKEPLKSAASDFHFLMNCQAAAAHNSQK